MNDPERNQQIIEFINQQYQLLNKCGINVEKQKIMEITNHYLTSTKTINEIIIEIEELVKQQIEKYKMFLKQMTQETNEAKEQLDRMGNTLVSDDEKVFGESLNINLVTAMMIFESIVNQDNLTEEEKTLLFSQQIAEKLSGLKDVMPGIRELDYPIITRLYKHFINDMDVIVPEWEMKMAYQENTGEPSQGVTVREGVPIFNADGTINPQLFDFSRAQVVYDFAQSHGKQLKLHTILWHKAFPNCLKQILVGKTPSEVRNITLRFLDGYLLQIASWAAERGYDFSQIDVLNEIAYDQTENIPEQKEHPELRVSDWSMALGDNPETKEPYFIDVLRIARKYFPHSQLLYNEYNEYHEPKCDAICSIVEQIKTAEAKRGITLLDGIGLQSHYSEYNPVAKRLTKPVDVYRSMAKLTNTGKALYRSEYDFPETILNGINKPEVTGAIKEADKKCGVKGFISWGNSDSLSWLAKRKATLVQSNGESKPEYEFFAQTYSQKRKQGQLQKEQPKTLTLKKPDLPHAGRINTKILLIIIGCLMLLIGISYLITR